MRKIKGPCHGCGEKDLYRGREELCQRCREKLDLAEEVLKLRKPKRGEIAVPIPWTYHAYRYVPHQPARDWNSTKDRRFQKAFDRFLRASFRVSSVWPSTEGVAFVVSHPFHGRNEYTVEESLVIPKKVLRPLVALYLSVYEAVECAYEEGKKDGRHFIQRLARGEIDQLKTEGIFDADGGREREDADA